MASSNEASSVFARLPQELLATAAALCLLAAADHLAIKPFVTSRIASKKDLGNARWFFVHAVANAFVVVAGLHALFIMLTDPHNALDARIYHDTSFFGSASSWPLTFVNAVHVYHMTGGFHLTSADYFHHLLFIPLLGFPGQVLLWGAVEPAGAVFISGLPGGISYFLLGLHKIGWVEPIVEKRITANLNAWVRTPGILITSFCVYQAMLYGRHTLPLWAPFIHVFLPPYNAIFYCKQAVANYTVHFLTSLIAQDDTLKARLLDAEHTLKAPTGLRKDMLVSWREAIAVPQRGC